MIGPNKIPKHKRKGLFWLFAALGTKEKFTQVVRGPYIIEGAEMSAEEAVRDGYEVIKIISNNDKKIAGIPFGLNGSYREEDYQIVNAVGATATYKKVVDR